MDQSEKELMQEREKLIFEWMRSNESFKSLARKYGKGGKITPLDDDQDGIHWERGAPGKAGQAAPAEAKPEPAESEQLDQWMQSTESTESFKTLAKKYGAKLGPKPSGT